MSYSIHLHQKLSFDSLTGLIIPITSISSHGVYFVNEDYAGFLLSGHFEEVLYNFFRLADVLAHDITARYAEKSRFGHLMGTCLGDEGLACPWRTIQ